MFDFGYSQYLAHAFPKDDLRPISCRGKNSQVGAAKTAGSRQRLRAGWAAVPGLPGRAAKQPSS